MNATREPFSNWVGKFFVMSAFLGLQERLQERIRVESELREEKNRLLDVIKDKEGELSKERGELTSRLQEHEQVIEVNWENLSVFITIFYQGPKGGRGGGGIWSPGTLKFLSWTSEPKTSVDLEPEQK